MKFKSGKNNTSPKEEDESSSSDGEYIDSKSKENSTSPKEEDESSSSDGECIDSPESGGAHEMQNEKAIGGVSNEALQEEKSFATMEGELDFEDEDVADVDVELTRAVLTRPVSENDEKKEDMILSPKSKDEPDDQSSEEDGQCTPENVQKVRDKKGDESVEEGEDDGGEISDEDDLEEGEVKDNSPVQKQPARQVCRFFNRGLCTWGNLCRFLHLSGNEKGNYNMFAPSPKYSNYGLSGNASANLMGSSNLVSVYNQRSALHLEPDFMSFPQILPPPIPVEPTPVESAWEKGLREARRLVQKANKRKENEPDFEEKSLNLSIDVNERNIPDYDKENEFLDKPYKKQNEMYPHRYEEPNDFFGYDNREVRERRGRRYENFDTNWTRQNMHKDFYRNDRERFQGRPVVKRNNERVSNQDRTNERWRDGHSYETQSRSRADNWVDPWRRSKTPKGRKHSRSRSGSCSSVSSGSYSDKSSRSSRSYSRSSSRTSCGSSISRTVRVKRKLSPPTRVVSIDGPRRFTSLKEKPRTRTSRSRSYTRSHSSRSRTRSRSSSSRSRSFSRTPSVSRSRSKSRSLSMDSVSSASTGITRSSSRTESLKNRNAQVSSHKKAEEKPVAQKVLSKGTSSNLYGEIRKNKQVEEAKDNFLLLRDADANFSVREETTSRDAPFPSLQHLLPTYEKAKEPVKGLHKQQIKLTLLNKPAPSKSTSLPKKELEVKKSKPIGETSKLAVPNTGVKRPLSPPEEVMPKKSASSRRDELLKRLKAVEDAIARKRSKV